MKRQINQNDQGDEAQRLIDEWKGKYLRALADYQNLEKRVAQEKSDIRAYAAQSVVTKLLPVVDSFERAEVHLKDEGLSLALKELTAFLSSQGVTKLKVAGKQFDPATMECVEAVEGPEGVVTEEVSPGYALHGKVIRVANVKVGRQEKSEARSTKFETNSNGEN